MKNTKLKSTLCRRRIRSSVRPKPNTSLRSANTSGKKYDQTKVRKLVAAGTKAINAQTTPANVKSTYLDYQKKILATVRTYKIKVSRSGPGSATMSRTVTYGSSYTVKLMPKAGHRIAAVKIDGKSKSLKNRYKFKNIRKKHTLKVTFK